MEKEWCIQYGYLVGWFRPKSRIDHIVVVAHKYGSAMKQAKKLLPDRAWFTGNIYMEYKKRER